MPQNNKTPLKNLRYNIWKRIKSMERMERSLIRDSIVTSLGIDRSTYYKWLLIKKNDRNDIPGKALVLFAKYFCVSIEELFNSKNKR